MTSIFSLHTKTTTSPNTTQHETTRFTKRGPNRTATAIVHRIMRSFTKCLKVHG